MKNFLLISFCISWSIFNLYGFNNFNVTSIISSISSSTYPKSKYDSIKVDIKKLLPENPVSNDPGDNFGCNIAASQENVAVSSYDKVTIFSKDDQGKLIPVYVFRDENYKNKCHILAMSNNTLLIGYSKLLTSYSNERKLFLNIIEKDESGDWQKTQELVPDDPEFEDFAKSFAIENNTIVVGFDYYKNNPDYPQSQIQSGAGIYVFEKNSNGIWEKTHKSKTKENETSFFRFAHSVDINNGTIAVGCPTDCQNSSSCGHIYTIKKVNGEWITTWKMRPPYNSNAFGIGYKVSISGDIIITTGDNDDSWSNHRVLHLFMRDENNIWLWKNSLPFPLYGYDYSRPIDLKVSGDRLFFTYHRSETDINGLDIYKIDVDQFGQVTFKKEHTVTPVDSDIDSFADAFHLFENNIYISKKYPAIVDIYQKSATNQWEKNESLFPTVDQPGRSISFGKSVAFHGDFALIGAPVDDSSGSAFLFKKENDEWNQIYKFKPSETELDRYFSNKLVMNSDTIAISAYNNSHYDYYNRGSVYIFEKDEDGFWQEIRISPPQLSEDALFGSSLYLKDNILLIGAKRDDDYKTNSGIVFVYEKGVDGIWSQKAELNPSGDVEGEYFGASVAIEGNLIAIGAPYFQEIDDVNRFGAIYIFEKNQSGEWIEKEKLYMDYSYGSHNVGYYKNIGSIIDIFDGKIITGFGSNSVLTQFWKDESNQWESGFFLPGKMPVESLSFGDRTLAYTSHLTPYYKYEGYANIYRIDSDNKWLNILSLNNDSFTTPLARSSVSVTGNSVLIGAPWDDDLGESAGAAYIIDTSVNSQKECHDELLNNCVENSICIETDITFRCECESGFSGSGDRRCYDINECSRDIDNCSENATCENLIGSFQCNCIDGFSGDGVTCDDLNECDAQVNQCDQNAICENSVGSYSCKCSAGFHGNGNYCNDIDECATEADNCNDNATCENTDGSFSCSCKAGFTGDGVNCADIDECATEADNCNDNATCENSSGSFSCSCNEGFEGDGVNCADINECTTGTDNCSDNATCENNSGSCCMH